MGKQTDYINKNTLEDEILEIVTDLLKGRTGLLKFIKTDLTEEQLEIIYACLSTLGKIGGSKSKTFLNTISRGSTTLSKTAQEAIDALDKKR